MSPILPPTQKIAKTARYIFPFAAKDPTVGKYFEAVIKFIHSNKNINKDAILNYLNKNCINSNDRDINIILKCVLISSLQRETRNEIIGNIDFNELWRLIAYSKTPFRIIREITEHLYNKRNQDIMKIFFDLTLLRIIHELNHYDKETTLHEIKMILVIFYHFDFFVENTYFEKLEDLRLRFVSESKKYPDVNVSIIEEFTSKLSEKRKGMGNVIATIPKGINKLPLPIQRHLAREGMYIEYFITHKHHLIALETLRYINMNNIDRLIRFIGSSKESVQKLRDW